MLAHLVTDREESLLGETATATFCPPRPCGEHPGKPTTKCPVCHPYRYALTRRWEDGLPTAGLVMCNPSVADAFQLDPTITRCVGFARDWACGGLLVLNLFALRTPYPSALYTHPDPIGPDNDPVIERVFSSGVPIDPVVVAWGVHGALKQRGRHVTDMLGARGVRPMCLGVTRNGEPLHPLYRPAATALISYRTR